MVVEIDDREYVMLKNLKDYLAKTDNYFLKKRYENYKFYDIMRKEEKKGFFGQDKFKCLTQTLYFYNDWIFVSTTQENLKELHDVLKKFKHRIKLNVVDKK